MKKKATLLLLLGIVLLLSLLLAVAAILSGGDDPSSPADTGDEATYLYLADEDPATIRAIDYVYEGAAPVRLVKTDKWRMVEDETLPVNQTTASTLANAMATVAVHRKLTDSAEDYEQYGLKDPTTYLTLTYTDGSELTFYLGKENTRLEGTRYLKTSRSDAVYLVADTMTTFFAYDRIAMLELDSVPELKASDLTTLTVENGRGSGIALTKEEDEEGEICWKAVYAAGGEETLTSSNLAGDILAALHGLTFNDPITCAGLSDAQRSEYGLDGEGSVLVRFTYESKVTSSAGESSSNATTTVKKTLSFRLGSEIESEGETRYVYLLCEDSGYLYRSVLSESLILLSDFPIKE